MERGQVSLRFPWESVLASAGLVAGARAAWIAGRDGYASIGLWNLAASSASRHDLSLLLPVLLAAIVLAWLARRTGPAGRGVLFVAGAALTFLLVIGHLFGPTFHAPGFHTSREKLAHAGALAAALGSTALLLSARRWSRALARLAALGVGLLTLAALGIRIVRPVSSTRAKGPNVILISLDTVRADRLGCYGYPLATTPEIDRFFARSSVRFTRAMSPQPFTLTAHMSLFTGLVPQVHGVAVEQPLAQGVPTLPRLLAQAGYLTFGIADPIYWLAPRYGFSRGFHLYRQMYGTAAQRNDALEPLLADLDDERFFLFLHYYDAHSDHALTPYNARPEDQELLAGWYHGSFSPTDDQGRWGTARLWAMNEEGRTLEDPEDRRYLSSLYDAGLRTLDAALGDLFDLLEELGRTEDTIVVLTSDHGEEFFEHGRVLHTQLYQDTLHVPLLFRLPRKPARSTCAELVSLVDVAPTVLDLVGIAPPAGLDGTSLAGLIRGGDGALDREQVVVGWEQAGLLTGDWSLLPPGHGDPRWRLFHLASDPGELRDLLSEGAPPPQGERLLELARREGLRLAEQRERIGKAEPVPLEEKTVEALRELGYAGE